MAKNILVRLFCIAKETRELAKTVIPLITDAPFKEFEIYNAKNLAFLLRKLSKSIDGLIYSENVTLNEFAQNNYEFLDVLKTTIAQASYVLENDKLELFNAKIDKLITQLNSLPFLQHQMFPSDDFLQGDESDEDFTEPETRFWYLLG